MAAYSLTGIEIAGVAAAVPRATVANDDYPFQSALERNLFIQNTGVAYRRVAPAHLTAADLCRAAAQSLLKASQVSPAEVGLLVFVTQTPDYTIPSNAPHLQHLLGLPDSAIAMDINQGCAGYVYGLSVASGLMQACGAQYALLLVGDVSTRCLSPEDKSVAPLFSDAGSATLLQKQGNSSAWHFHLGTDGSGYDNIIIPAGGSRQPLNAEMLKPRRVDEGIVRARNQLILAGIPVLNFSVKRVPDSVKAVLDHASWLPEEVDFYLFHQANLLLNETIRKRLQLPAEKVPYSLQQYGNTSSATIPITLVSRLAHQLTQLSLKLVFSGFGVGLSWGSVAMETKHWIVPPLLELD